MSRLEAVDGDTWRDLLAADAAVLVLGRSDCTACALWKEELQAFLAADEAYPHVRFGYLQLDEPGLADLKRAHTWIADVCELPTNLLWRRGVKRKTWLGGGTDRLAERLHGLRPMQG